MQACGQQACGQQAETAEGRPLHGARERHVVDRNQRQDFQGRIYEPGPAQDAAPACADKGMSVEVAAEGTATLGHLDRGDLHSNWGTVLNTVGTASLHMDRSGPRGATQAKLVRVGGGHAAHEHRSRQSCANAAPLRQLLPLQQQNLRGFEM